MRTQHDNCGEAAAVQTHLAGQGRIVSLVTVILAAFGVGLSFGIAFPLTALTLEAWGTPKWQIGLAGAAPSFAVLLALPFVPRLVHRLGVVKAIVSGCVIGALGFFALSRFDTAGAWIVVRFLMSAGLALPWLAGETWINLVAEEKSRGRVIALYAISFFSGYSAGPILLDAIGLKGPGAFVAGAISMALAGLPILVAARFAPSLSETDHGFSILNALRLAPAGMAGAFIGGLAEMSYLSLFPNVALAGGLDQAAALRAMSLMTLGGCILQLPIGWLADTASKRTLTLALTAAFVGLTLAMPFVFQSRSLTLAAAFLIGGVILGFYTIGLAIVGDEAKPDELATANAAFLVMYQLGAIIGPTAAGMAMSHAPVWGFVMMMSAGMTFSGLVFFSVAPGRGK